MHSHRVSCVNNLKFHVTLRSLIGLFNWFIKSDKSGRQAKTIRNVAGGKFTRGFATRKFLAGFAREKYSGSAAARPLTHPASYAGYDFRGCMWQLHSCHLANESSYGLNWVATRKQTPQLNLSFGLHFAARLWFPVESWFFEPPRETKIGTKNQRDWEITDKITVFNWGGETAFCSNYQEVKKKRIWEI